MIFKDRWNLDLKEQNGVDGGELPVPGTYVIDRDGTLLRMVTGRDTPGTMAQKRQKAAIIAAFVVYVSAVGVGAALGLFPA